MDVDLQVRIAAFNWLSGQVNLHGDVLPRKLLEQGFDSFMIGVTPDYIIRVREDILDEEDGPVLQHGLKELHNSHLILPSSKHHYPSRDALARRYSKFVG